LKKRSVRGVDLSTLRLRKIGRFLWRRDLLQQRQLRSQELGARLGERKEGDGVDLGKGLTLA
jgi:hypothetical protein